MIRYLGGLSGAVHSGLLVLPNDEASVQSLQGPQLILPVFEKDPRKAKLRQRGILGWGKGREGRSGGRREVFGPFRAILVRVRAVVTNN